MKVIVALIDRTKIDETEAQLIEAGLKVSKVLRTVGVITGETEDSEPLKSVPNVRAVEPDRIYTIAEDP